MLSRSLFTSALLGSLIKFASAHFYLNHPPTIGFDDALEASAPCGSFPVDFSKDNVTDFHVGGDYIALTSIHPVATWLFRATLDQSALPSNWTSLLPTIQQQGLGDYCEPSVQVPQSFAGQKGVIGVVQDAPDGILYQCSTVNFVAGSAVGSPPKDACSNVTGLTAQFTNDNALSMLPVSAAATSATGATLGTTLVVATATVQPSGATASSKSSAFSNKDPYAASAVGAAAAAAAAGVVGTFFVFRGVLC